MKGGNSFSHPSPQPPGAQPLLVFQCFLLVTNLSLQMGVVSVWVQLWLCSFCIFTVCFFPLCCHRSVLLILLTCSQCISATVLAFVKSSTQRFPGNPLWAWKHKRAVLCLCVFSAPGLRLGAVEDALQFKLMLLEFKKHMAREPSTAGTVSAVFALVCLQFLL